MELRRLLAIVLAGGAGKRLYPLTMERAKPAVPFGGIYRIIDFTLSNCINSNIRKVLVLPQYKSDSLDRHLRQAWNIFHYDLGEYIFSIPPQQRVSEHWYQGTCDAIYQNIYTMESINPKYVMILSGDHIYKMNYAEMLDFHVSKHAEMTIATIEVSKKEAKGFGVMEIDDSFKVSGFHEKPEEPVTLPNDSEHSMASMGVYIFNTDTLFQMVNEDSKENTEHDFGKNIIPRMIQNKSKVYAYNFKDENKKKAKYWRDVGTIQAYWEANMDLVSVDPSFNLYDMEWPIRSFHCQAPPAKTVFASKASGDNETSRMGMALDSMISNGCIISGGEVRNSVLSPNVRVNSYSLVENSVIFSDVNIGRYAKIRNTIIDKGVTIPPYEVIGYNSEEDRKRYFVNEQGIVIIPKARTMWHRD